MQETWETWVRSTGWEDPLEKEMATHSGIIVWIIPWTEQPGGLQSHGVAKSWTSLSDWHFYFLSYGRENDRIFMGKIVSGMVG